MLTMTRRKKMLKLLNFMFYSPSIVHARFEEMVNFFVQLLMDQLSATTESKSSRRRNLIFNIFVYSRSVSV